MGPVVGHFHFKHIYLEGNLIDVQISVLWITALGLLCMWYFLSSGIGNNLHTVICANHAVFAFLVCA